jgi:hypothetical protein
MFAMVFDRDPTQLHDVPGGLLAWVQHGGGWAAFGVFLWLMLGYTRMRNVDRARIPGWLKSSFVVCVAVSLIAYVLSLGLSGIAHFTPNSRAVQVLLDIGLTLGGGAALIAACLPFVANLPALRFRRIWALTRLTFKEAVRSRVLYAFSLLLLVFLFASWYIPHKPENQVRNYVWVVYFSMTILLLVAAVILTAFSIPKDIRQQTIHTIITKPVERFEILLGRFLGFTALMTLVLLIMTSISVIYVLRGVDPEAAAESLKAREPFYGELKYENTKNEREGTNVGREWNYRSYITAARPNQEYAVW